MDKYTEKHHDVILNYSINKNKAVASIKKTQTDNSKSDNTW